MKPASPDRPLEIRPQRTDGGGLSPSASSPVALLPDLVESWRVLGRSDLEAAARMAPVVVADWSRPQLCPTYLQAVAAGS